MTVMTTLKDLPFDVASAYVDDGGVFIDLRPAPAYLEVHIPASISLPYEFGPGLASRARDCLPLDLPLVLLDEPDVDPAHVAAALRGKGFDVIGRVSDGLTEWGQIHGPPRSTEVVASAPVGATVLDVGDPGAVVPDDAITIPVERLWIRTDEVKPPVAVAAGFGVRAALAVGILERAGIVDVHFLRTR